MELQFETLDYQTHAIQAAVDLFIGQPNQQMEFGLKAQNDMRFVANLPLQINKTWLSNKTSLIFTALSLRNRVEILP